MHRRQFVTLAALGAAAVTLAGAATLPAVPRRARFKAIAFDGFPILDPRPVFALAEILFPGRGAALADAWKTRQFEYSWLRTAGGQYADFLRLVLTNADLQLTTRNAPAAQFGDHNNYSLGLAANWDLFGSLGSWRQLQALQAAADSKRAEADFQSRALVLRTRLAYFQVQLAATRLRLLAQSLNLAQSQDADLQLRLKAGTHELNGDQALALARTRHNDCRPAEDDRARVRRQQKILSAIKDKVTSFETFIRLPWVSWAAPKAIRSDMSGPTLLGLVGAEMLGGNAKKQVLTPSGNVTLPDGGAGLTVDDATKKKQVAEFLRG